MTDKANMSETEFAPPPREVRHKSEFAGYKSITVCVASLIALAVAIGGCVQLAAYNRLVRNGKVVQVPINRKDSFAGKSTSYYLYYNIPADPLQQEFRQSVSQDEYDSIASTAKLTVTFDPSDPRNQVVGSATTADLGTQALRWSVGILAIALIGGAVYWSITSTAGREWTAMSSWIYADAPVVSVKTTGGRSSSLIVTVRIDAATPSRRSFDTGTSTTEIHFGDHIPVLYNPEPDNAGVMRVSAIKYVALGKA